MFERYTEKARRVIFFARYEASQFGSTLIETEYLLLGILREDKALTNRFLRSSGASIESIRKQIEAHTTVREWIATSLDLPLSNEAKRVLAYANSEAEQLGQKHIGTEHLLLGILREEKCFAAEILHERGLRLLAIRDELAKAAHQPPVPRPSESAPLVEPSADLVQAARGSQLPSVVGRDQELECIIEILLSRHKRNPLLIGQPGAGKTAIVEGLAQRIANRKVPSLLANKRLLAITPELMDGSIKDLQKSDEMTRLLHAGVDPSDVILFIDDLPDLSRFAASESASIIKRALLSNTIQCVGTVNASEYRDPAEAVPWLGKYFRAVYVRPLDEQATFSVLMARKQGLEEFHRVTYTAEALEFAVHSSGTYLPGRSLPAKAVELLDAAGALVKLRQPAPPEELSETEKRIRFLTMRLENAIANHEFEKARAYSDEERKERENLKHHLGDSPSPLVGPDDLQQVVSRWSAYPYCP
jgi:ATP-dependent Clp protease ATP-binding subunit ClpC